MKRWIAPVALAIGLLTSCKKDNTPENLQQTNPTGTTLLSGSFASNAHTTSGTVKVVESGGKKYLNFENFKTDNGPDLRVYLSKNTGIADFVNLGTLKAVSGNFNYELTAAQNPNTHNYVLIWCEDFSVLFGNAVLR
jgi:hypothetical protein